MLSSEGEGDGPGEIFVGDRVGDRSKGDRKEDWRGGEGGRVDEECLLLVKSLVTEAVAWEVLASGKLGGATSCGGGRILEPVVEFDTKSKAKSAFSSWQKQSYTYPTARPRVVSLSRQPTPGQP